MSTIRLALATLLLASPAFAQTTDDPFPRPIEAEAGVVRVNFTEFATIPDFDGEPARMMILVDEPGTRRMFVNDMRGPIFSISYDGSQVRPYLDVNASEWGVRVQSTGRERGVQSFVFHPQFNQPDTPGYGKLYTWSDSEDVESPAHFTAEGGERVAHHTVLHEWTTRNPEAAEYDGGAPRELARFAQPFANHNGGQLAFNPTAAPGSPDFGMLYVGNGDGGSGGDPLDLSQNLRSSFGKILRIDPLGSNSANGRYGIPADNPFVGRADALPEIYAYGARNPQRFSWDPRNGNLFMADIGQNIVEKVTLVPAGANLGWKAWEGSFRFISAQAVSLEDPRSDPSVTYPVVEYDQTDPLLLRSSAVTGVFVYRSEEIPQLRDLLLFGDMPSGEVFYVSADNLPRGGQDAIRRVLFNTSDGTRTFLQLVQAKNEQQGREPAPRADMRFGYGPDGQLLLINKYDGIVRLLVP